MGGTITVEALAKVSMQTIETATGAQHQLRSPTGDATYLICARTGACTREADLGLKPRRIKDDAVTARRLRAEMVRRLGHRPDGWPKDERSGRKLEFVEIMQPTFDEAYERGADYRVGAGENCYLTASGLKQPKAWVLKESRWHPLDPAGPTAKALFAAVREHQERAV